MTLVFLAINGSLCCLFCVMYVEHGTPPLLGGILINGFATIIHVIIQVKKEISAEIRQMKMELNDRIQQLRNDLQEEDPETNIML